MPPPPAALPCGLRKTGLHLFVMNIRCVFLRLHCLALFAFLLLVHRSRSDRACVLMSDPTENFAAGASSSSTSSDRRCSALPCPRRSLWRPIRSPPWSTRRSSAV
jgi:hypothetical protein